MNITINGRVAEVPAGAIAYKHADPTEDARWVYDESDLREIRSADPSLLVTVPTTYTEILAAHSITIEQSSEDASYASASAMPRAEAEQVASELEAIGVEASTAIDHDDRSMAWLHVTPPSA